MSQPDSRTRQRILAAALKRFAECGYAGTSVQDIVDDARVTKPTLYYYFQNKAELYQALLDWAHDERYRLMLEAGARGRSLAGKLTEILVVHFEFLKDHRELMRLAFATAFAARGEIPAGISYLKKCRRNFECLHALIRQGLAAGELDDSFDSEHLARGIQGMMSLHVMAHLVDRQDALDRRTAREIVRLFLDGAAGRSRPAEMETT